MRTDNKSSKTESDKNTLTQYDDSVESKKVTSNSQPTKWIFLILLLAGLALLSESLFEKTTTPIEAKIDMQSKTNFVSQDLQEMYRKGQIPKYFFQLRSIKWSYYDNELKNQIPTESIPFRTSEDGAFKLEVDAFSSVKKDSKIAILQMNLIEVKSGNKVWELSRNYEIPKQK